MAMGGIRFNGRAGMTDGMGIAIGWPSAHACETPDDTDVIVVAIDFALC